jgi:putative molybdopterin biosynthesis protein
MGGILAIKNREAHIAGTHLYDEETGEYNVPFIRKFLGDIKLRLVNLVYREQGLMVKKGNPKSIKSIQDLVRSDVVFVNRQPGSGTRLLTDKCLRDFTISPGSVKGYDRVEFTHMAVASAVQSGVADAGVGIYASSVALGLDFIPIARERYDLIIPGEYAEDEKMLALLGIISDDMEFRTGIMKLGGYDVSDMGRIMYEQ